MAETDTSPGYDIRVAHVWERSPAVAAEQPFGRATLALASLWALMLTCAGLRSLEKYVFWYGTIPLALALIQHHGRIPWRSIRLVTIGGALLVVAVISTSLTDTTYNLLQAGKFAAILLVLAPLMTTGKPLGVAMLFGVELGIYLNCALLLLWWFGGSQAAAVVSPGRYGTVLAGSGTLWRMGAISLVWSTLRYLDGSPSNVRNLAAIAAAIGMFVADGSRTGILAIGLAGLATAWYLARQLSGLTRRLASAIVIVSALIGGGVWYIIDAGQSVNDLGGSLRSVDFADALLSGTDSRVVHDDVRRVMFTDILAEIQTHPLSGSGMGKTRSLVAGGGEMVNHYSYLQMWADTGLLGFVAYMLVVVGVAATAVRRLHKNGSRMNPDGARAAYSGTYLLLCWVMACGLHAVSTELTEWLMYLAGLALVSELLQSPLQKTPAAAPAPQLRPLPRRRFER